MITKIISGGQTGADLGGLKAAKLLGIPTGGTAPRGYLTENGPMPEMLKDFCLSESESNAVVARTRANVLEADATLIFCFNENSPGSRLTRTFCENERKFHKIIDPRSLFCINEVKGFLNEMENLNLHVLNIAGNRESIAKGIELSVFGVLIESLQNHY